MFWTALLPLSFAGLFGVAIFALLAPRQLLDNIPVAGDARKRLLVAVQPTILLLTLTAAGSAVAQSIGSQSLIVNLARGETLAAGWSVSIASFVGVGMLAGALLYGADRWSKPLWSGPEDRDLISDWKPGNVIPGITYGGITEEVMMRWGLMGLVLWGLARIGGADEPSAVIVALAIVIAAILFAAGHLPGALVGGRKSGRFILRILALNFVAGLLFGWLFWRWNLETAMAAHAGFHIGGAILVLVLRSGRAEAA